MKKNVSIHVGDKWASLEPYDGYKLSFAIDFGHPAIDETAQFVEVDFNKENSHRKRLPTPVPSAL